jgi:hypothetical protein
MSSSVTVEAYLGDLVDQHAERLGERGVVERGAALGVRRLPVSFEDPRDDGPTRLRDV